MADYRDDRAALHARVEQQEGELEQLRAEAERLRARAELADALEEELGKVRTPRRPPNVAAIAAVAAVGAVVMGGVMLTLRSAAPPVAAPPRELPPPVDTAKPAPPPRPVRENVGARVIPACACEDGDGGSTALTFEVGASMSFGSNATTYVSWGLVDAAGKRARLTTGGTLVPPGAVSAGAMSMRLACPRGAFVLALDQRVTAWSPTDGHELWSAALPAPVGESRGGPLAPTCEKLALDARGNVVIPHAGGRTVLGARDGKPVR
jgi:hypothetical protein